jgi:hypothetical protein
VHDIVDEEPDEEGLVLLLLHKPIELSVASVVLARLETRVPTHAKNIEQQHPQVVPREKHDTFEGLILPNQYNKWYNIVPSH